ncbi:MAG: hypothetical protein GY757_00365 [bacterium]|nr:hypothetical protein [bacterium]
MSRLTAYRLVPLLSEYPEKDLTTIDGLTNRGVYQKEIEHFDVKDIKKEYRPSPDKLEKEYRHLQGKYCKPKGIACSEDQRWLEV